MCCGRKKTRGGRSGTRAMLFGMLAGLVIGLLLAPKPGADTLSDLLVSRDKFMDKLIRKLPV